MKNYFDFQLSGRKFWGQTLLAIITLEIYYPWAFAKIGQRFLVNYSSHVVS